ncbi:hypothetical protein [Nocardia anaemiae]|uniref:hypothetical protein n=1 Tax=Nocardia anaemiae TaxID=263910 RepID=UPI0007A4B4E5|nr:hypothetical protein [Nocardia anaemiae]
MRRDALRTSRTQDGGKVAVWQLIGSSARILRLQLSGESFTAYRLPSRTTLLSAQPGTVVFDADADLADARELFPQHEDLWDVLRDEYWAALLSRTDLPNSL